MEHLVLNGTWQFSYQPEGQLVTENIPPLKLFDAVMPVPGYWDDNLDSLKRTIVWSRDIRLNPNYRKIEYPLGSGKPFDTALPYLIGNGWYRKMLHAPENLEDQVLLLTVPGAVTDIAVFVNKQRVAFHQNHMTGICVPIQDYLQPGQDNELLLAVSNERRNVISCGYRGFKGFTGGIYGDVTLHQAAYCAVTDVYACPSEDLNTLTVNAQLQHSATAADVTLEYSLYAPDTHKRVCHTFSKDTQITWDSAHLRPWSDQDPYLYTLEVKTYVNDELCDTHQQNFGLRRMAIRGQEILINGHPVILRGFTEHGYYPLTCTAPLDAAYYRDAMRKYRQIGFNWIRFHTNVPNEDYLTAADEYGMLIQVEAPNEFTDPMWTDILLKCRKHPSVVLYCCGNEVRIKHHVIDRFEKLAAEQKELVPDTLFSPMQALLDADGHFEEEGQPIVDFPFPHNKTKLDRLKQFDVLQPHRHIGIDLIEPTWQELEPLVAYYEKPYTSHELGIHDSYINLDLEKRYEGTRIGTDLYSGARKQLDEAGMLPMAPTYFRHSCYWTAAIRKLEVERLRLINGVCGYDYLGAIDYHWHRCGYTPGVLNEFFEFKPGENAVDILRYNGENLVLADVVAKRNYWCGETITYNAFASIYGAQEPGKATLTWRLLGADGHCYARHSRSFDAIETHHKFSLSEISVTAPLLAKPEHCKLQLTLDCDHYYLENEYDFWIFPQIQAHPGDVLVYTQDDPELISKLEQGANVLILSPLDMKTMPINFMKGMAGRPIGCTATVLHDHPIWKHFPQEGWCDFQFYPMMVRSCTAVFNDDDPLPFDPILETVNSYKIIFKQAAMFEFTVGSGKALVCTFHLDGNDPAQVTLLAQILRYMNSSDFAPKHKMTAQQADKFFHAGS